MYENDVTVAPFPYFKQIFPLFKIDETRSLCVLSVCLGFLFVVCQAVHVLCFVVHFLVEFEKVTHP